MKTIPVKDLDMAQYLGRGIQIFLKDGTEANFKPTQLVDGIYSRTPDGDYWVGYDDEGNRRSVARYEIEFVRV